MKNAFFLYQRKRKKRKVVGNYEKKFKKKLTYLYKMVKEFKKKLCKSKNKNWFSFWYIITE